MSTTDHLAERYGRPDPTRARLLRVALGGVVAVFGAWLGWTVWQESTPEVESELVSWQVIDDSSVEVNLAIAFADESVSATCTVRAYAEDHGVVGQSSFDPAEGSTARDGRYTHVMRTDRRATAVEKVGCTADGQNRPR